MLINGITSLLKPTTIHGVAWQLNSRVTGWFCVVAALVLITCSLVQNPITCSGDIKDNHATVDKAWVTAVCTDKGC